MLYLFKGAQMMLPAHGWAGQRQPLNSFAAYFAKRNTNLGGGESEGGAGIPSPQPPSFPRRPSVQFGARSAPSVPFKKGSDFVKQTHQN